MRLHSLFFLVLSLPFLAYGAEVLTLADVLASVQKNYPPLLVALQERNVADADVLAALGRFDLVSRVKAESTRLGYYEFESVEAGVEQYTPYQGLAFYGGYAKGTGDFPSYYGSVLTRSLGEYRAGLKLPLLEGRAIDYRRAELQKARLGVRLAELTIDQQRLAIVQAATRRYWDWVAAAQRFQVAQQVLDIAMARDSQLREAAKLGQIPDFEVLDNERIILQRRSQLVETERGFQLASLDLSLFYRDDMGNPRIPTVDQTPAGFPPPEQLDEAKLAQDIESALNRRPDLARFQQQKEQLNVDRRLAENQRLPTLDFGLAYYQDNGTTTRILQGPRELRTSLTWELPFQRRTATGKLQSTQAKLNQLNLRERFQRDQVITEVRDAYSAVVTAYKRVGVIRDEVATTRRVEAGERVRFDLGDTNLFTLNLRELATAEASIREVNAYADYYRAFAVYELAIAQALARTTR
ncbi:multidrug transporter [Bryobacterales bacterium F-183]|nr:multidrug transporter [Bryobacterales bacterium F-183]